MGNCIDNYRAVYRAVRVDNYRTFLVYQCCVLVELQSSVLSFKQSFEQIFELKGETPLDPPAHCVLYLLYGQSSYRGSGRAFIELRVELCVKLCIELLQSYMQAYGCLYGRLIVGMFIRVIVQIFIEPFIELFIQTIIEPSQYISAACQQSFRAPY